MDMLIVYGSCYGTARRYAEKFAEMTGGRAYPYDARELPQADTVVCFCAMYAGGLKGLKRTAKRICAEKTSVFAVVTVGLADPDDGENRSRLQNAAETAVPEALRAKLKVFHLRGGIDYARLSSGHKLLMKLLYAKESKIPEPQRNAETRAFLETYGKKADFTNFGRLEDILYNITRQ